MPVNPLRRPGKALVFAVEFAQEDFGQLSAIEHQQVVALIDLFLLRQTERRRGSTLVVSQPRRRAVKLSRKAVQELQRRVLEYLGAIAHGRAHSMTLTLTYTAIPLPVRFRKQYRSAPKVLADVTGETVDMFLYRLKELVTQIGADKILSCKAPDCPRLFFKQTRKEFCSSRCQARIYMRENPQYRL